MKGVKNLKAYFLEIRGFTLIEVLVVFVIFSLIFGAILSFLAVGRDYFSLLHTQISLQQDLRNCLRTMVYELSESSVNSLQDENGEALNTVQKNSDPTNTTWPLVCLPQDQDCVYSALEFKIPLQWNNGQISQWSNYITYRLTPQSIVRIEGGSQQELVHNLKLEIKDSDNSNSSGSSFESLGGNRLKIFLVAERADYKGRRAKAEIGSIVYLRN